MGISDIDSLDKVANDKKEERQDTETQGGVTIKLKITVEQTVVIEILPTTCKRNNKNSLSIGAIGDLESTCLRNRFSFNLLNNN